MTDTPMTLSQLRRSILDRDTLRELTTLSPHKALLNIGFHWLLIIGSFTMAAKSASILSSFGAVVIIGLNIYGLAIIGHDGLHRRIFKSVYWNDLINDLFILSLFGTITRVNRHNHMQHHKSVPSPNDPDRHKYTHNGKEPVIPYLFFLSGILSFGPSFYNIFFPKKSAGSKTATTVGASKERYKPRDIGILLFTQGTLLLGLSYFIGWWGYPLLWVLPVYLFAFRADLTRVFCEHSGLEPDPLLDSSFRFVSFQSNMVERAFFAPHNMNCHVAHHLWPPIPYYNLPKAEALIRDWDQTHPNRAQIQWRGSYLGYLLAYSRWRSNTPSVTATNR